jgi:Zn-dependent peptidase ImmA (M78 family)
LSADKALIQLSFRYKTDDQVWFTFFHEAGHILLHGKRDVFIEEGADGEREKQADEFALNLLLPPAKFRKFVPVRAGRGYSKSAIESFADQIGIAPGIVVGRLQHGGLLPYTHCNGLKRPFALAIQEPGSSN